MKSVVFSFLLVPFLAMPAFAGNFSLDFNDHSTQVGYVQKLGTENYGDTVVRARFLYNDDTSTNLFGLSGGVIGTPGNVDGLNLGLDVGINGGRTRHSRDLLTIGLGFNAEYVPPVLRGFGVDAHFVYSPSIFSFLDSEDYFEWGVGTSFQILPNAKVTLAYQKIQVDVSGYGDRDLDDTVRLGIMFEF